MKTSPNRRAVPARRPDQDFALLRGRLTEAEETLEAIRNGHVEALLVQTPTGPRVYTLEGTNHRYQRLVETMNEGALLVSEAGVVLYSNVAFATILEAKLETIVGRSLIDFVDQRSLPTFRGLLATATKRAAAEEILLRRETGLAIPVYLSASPNGDGATGVSVIVTNLAAQKRNEEIVASERLANAILDQSADAVVVCDTHGIVTRASRAALEISSDRALLQHVFVSFPLRSTDGAERMRHPATRALEGEVVSSVEMTLDIVGREPMDVRCTAVPLAYQDGAILGCVMTVIDITKQKRVEAERRELLDAERAARVSAEHARSEAEASNRSKDEFLATVSHELRTPLNAIVGWSRMMSDETLPEERRRHAIDVIRRNADAQARLIEDLLDVSRIISGQMRLEVKSLEPGRVITAVIETVRPAVDAKEIRLEVVLDSEDALVLGDEARLQQVIWNLLSNAVKFTPRKGRILISLRRVDSGVEIDVTDNGEGIRADFLPYVFDRFRQAVGGISRVHGGLGLGLAISRHLVELHGGQIAVTSAGPRQGSTFTVRLPRAALRESPVPEIPLPGREPPSASTAFERADLEGLHVLLVEDDDDSRELLATVLTKCGARVTDTSSGIEALALFATDAPDVLVSDIGMPVMDGYTLIRSVRGLAGGIGKHTPALALTAYARSEDRRRALAEGFQMHLAKPADPSEFAMTVASLAKFAALARIALAATAATAAAKPAA